MAASDQATHPFKLPTEEFIARARTACPEYEPMEPYSVFNGRCKFDWLRDTRHITCNVPFIRREICKTGDPTNVPEEHWFPLPDSKQKYWKSQHKCSQCGRQYVGSRPTKCECGSSQFETRTEMTDPEMQRRMYQKRMALRKQKPAIKHAVIRKWIQREYGII
jgi:hypothetical protein